MSLSAYRRPPTEETYRTFSSALVRVPETLASVVKALLELCKALLTVLCESVRIISVTAVDLCGSREGASFAVGFGLGYSCSLIRYWFLTRGPLTWFCPEPLIYDQQL